MNARKEIAYAVLIGALALSGCKSADTGKQTPLPNGIEQSDPAVSAWKNLSTTQRIHQLELKTSPGNLDTDTEIVRAISELYSQQMPINMDEGVMQSNTFFVDADMFLKKYQENLGRSFLNDSEREEAAMNPEFIFNAADSDRTKRQILINKSRISDIANDIKKNMSAEDIKRLGDYDLETIAEESIVTHAISHLNQSGEKLDFSPIPISTNEGLFLITGIHDLNLQITNLSNSSNFALSGAGEAMTEQVAGSIDRQSILFIYSTAYYPATLLVGELNNKAGITQKEFDDYYFGKKSIKDLLIKWGSIRDPKNPDMNSGIRLYYLTALAADPRNNFKTINQFAEEEIGQKLFS